jgi:hypothetical protein
MKKKSPYILADSFIIIIKEIIKLNKIKQKFASNISYFLILMSKNYHHFSNLPKKIIKKKNKNI